MSQIERLLVSGLDHYFAGRYQDAIDVWTRVSFLERGHSRARAYIERARSAIAEQQRQADELVHRGRVAYESGEMDEARRWLDEALERGPASDDAWMLQREIDRFGAIGPLTPSVRGPEPRPDRWVVALLIVAAGSALALGAAPIVAWFGDGSVVDEAPVFDRPLPVPRVGAEALARAERQEAEGHLVEALRILEGIDVGDPSYDVAQRVRGSIQGRLLDAARRSRRVGEQEPR